MKIGFDFDGVFTNLSDLKARGARKLFGIEIPQDLMHKHILLRKGLLTEKQYNELQEFIARGDFGKSAKAVRGMKAAVQKLQKEGYELSIVTSRDERALGIAKEWLVKQNIEIPIVSAGFGKSKANFAKDLGLHVFVDDDLFKLEPLCGIVPHRILFSWPYNQHIQESSYVKRVNSWPELYHELALLGMWHISGFPTIRSDFTPPPRETLPQL